jgi:hypothetical protein
MNDLVISDDKVLAIRELTAELGNSLNQIDMLYLKIGALLAFIKEKKLYTFYASHTDTWRDYLKEIDMGIGVSQADHYIRVFKTFGDAVAGRRIAFKRLLLIHPLVKDDESRDRLLDMAEHTPWQGLQASIASEKGKIPADACEHPIASRGKFSRCSLCGAWIKE